MSSGFVGCPTRSSQNHILHNMKSIWKFFILLIECTAIQAQTLELPSVFSDHMVIQRETLVNVWGRAEPGAEIQVAFARQRVNGTADTDGNWMIQIQPMKASSQPQCMEVRTGEESVIFEDVLVGDVWLCSGQSNMAWMLCRDADRDIELAAAENPNIRLHQVNRLTTPEPRFSSGDKWVPCHNVSVAQFSAVGYFFGKTLQEALGIPIGLIDSTWGGTPIVAWTRKEALLANPHTESKIRAWDTWAKRRNNETRVSLNKDRPSNLANSMLTPICPFSLKGCVWYQGEDDVNWKPDQYQSRLKLMISDWRQRWGQFDLPFGIVQLANFGGISVQPMDSNWARIRDSQYRFTRDSTHTGLIVVIDQGEADNIHPARKKVVGRRLARWALTDVYGILNLAGGPLMRSFKMVDCGIEITFDSVGRGLTVLNGPRLQEFCIAGDNRVFHRADATIIASDKILVRSDTVPIPVAVRYAWADNPIHANLTNDQGLPASPFRTDTWE